jgi:hypothetical protein
MGHQLLPGAVALFDALGFRGIWQRFPPSAIVTSLTNLRAQATIEASRASLFAHVFSDTIAIGAVPKPDDRDPTLAMHNVLDAIVDVVDHVVHVGLCGDPPLLFRGCIAVGELIATPEVLVGAPVDAASELYERRGWEDGHELNDWLQAESEIAHQGRRQWPLRTTNPVRLNFLSDFSQEMAAQKDRRDHDSSVVAPAATLKMVKTRKESL